MASTCAILRTIRFMVVLLAIEAVFSSSAVREFDAADPLALRVPADNLDAAQVAPLFQLREIDDSVHVGQPQAASMPKGVAKHAEADKLQKDGPVHNQTILVRGTVENAEQHRLVRIVTGGITAFAQIGPPEWRNQLADLGKHLFAGVSVAALVKIACLVGNILVQVSPLSQVQDWEGKGSTGSNDPAPYVSMALGGCQWCSYGLAAWLFSHNDGFLILVYANCLGALLGCYYTRVFYRNCSDDSRTQTLKQYLKVVLCLVVAQICMWLLLPHPRALAAHSFIAGGCSFVMAASLLTGLPAVFSTGDTSGICGPLILANFVGAILWAYWGVMMGDVVVIAANMFAASSSAICLYAKFLRREADAPKAKVRGSW